MVRVRTISRWLAVAMLAGVLVPSAAWAVVPPQVKPYRAVSFANATSGYIAGIGGAYGFDGVLLRTSNGGASWSPSSYPNRPMIAVTASGAHATALTPEFDGLYATTNSGLNWTPLTRLLWKSVDLADVAYLSNGRRVVVGQHKPRDQRAMIASSWNNGDWDIHLDGPIYPIPPGETEPPPTHAELTAIDAAGGTSTAWAVGQDRTLSPNARAGWKPLIYRTTDGSTWTTQPVGVSTTKAPGLNCVAAATAYTAFIGQENRYLLRTTNGGGSWSSIGLPTSFAFARVSAIDAYDANHVLVVGSTLSNQGRIAWTSNATSATPDWTVNTTVARKRLFGAQMLSPTRWIVVGDYETILRTSDAGAIWTVGTASPVAPAATAIALSTRSTSSLAYGSTFTVRGTLRKGTTGLSGQRVILQSATPTGSYRDTTSAMTGAGGAFTFSVKPYTKTRYRVRFAGASAPAYAPSGPTVGISATPKSYVRTPIAPKTMKRTKYYTVYGYLKPKHTSGTYPVRIYKWKKLASGKYKSYGYVSAKASNYSSYTKYSKKLKLSSKGKWRLRAYARADSLHASAWSSGYDYVTVK